METFNKLTKLVHSIPKLHEAGYKKGKEEGYKSGYDKGKDDGIAIGTSAFDQPLHIVENGEYTSPSGKRYNPITVNVPGEVYEDIPLTITKNGVHEAPQKTRYTPITVDIPKQTLKPPTISVNVATATVYVDDTINGVYTNRYLLYVNDELVGTSTSSRININDFVSVTDDIFIKVKCEETDFFNESDFSNIVDWNLVRDGTPGLTYSGTNFTGLGTVTATDIYVASVINGTTITYVAAGFPQLSNRKLYFPDTIRSIWGQSFYNNKNCTYVFGAGLSEVGQHAFFIFESAGKNSNNIFDFRKVTKVPIFATYCINGNNNTYIVSDDLFDEWIMATNWGNKASRTIRASDYNAPPGDITTVDGVPFTITENGTTYVPVGVRYNPIIVDIPIPKPTLNTPEIYASAGTGNLIVNDYVNGLHTSEYLLYVDGVERATYTEKAIPMQEYIVTGEEQLQVKCRNIDFFNESELSNVTTWNFLVNGTPGLTYSGDRCTSIGTATAIDIYVASIVNGTVITAMTGFGSTTNKIIRLPDTITNINNEFCRSSTDITVIFGKNITTIAHNTFTYSNRVTLVFSKATKIPTLLSGIGHLNLTIVVPDELYEDWIVATNWSTKASVTIRLSEYIAQGGVV